MNKMWAGMTSGQTAEIADDFNSSIRFDQRLAEQDITGSIAHAGMLCHCGILTEEEQDKIIEGLREILKELHSGSLPVDGSTEDIHMFVEQTLTARIGETGKKLHTARSRNDQVALDMRLYLRTETKKTAALITALIQTLIGLSEQYKETVMPGYTHLQRAQPVTFGHQLLAYAFMLLRDLERFTEGKKRINRSPIGCCALAGTTYPTDRDYEAALLGFDEICMNSIDGVSDRDFCLEWLADASILMTHLSRFAEELILWSSWEFRFIRFSDRFTTGSSIMPQKKNPDMAELIRGKTGRVYGDLFALLTVLKGLPLAYNKDMQEDKESVFDACDTVEACLNVLNGMLGEMEVFPENMMKAAQEGFINATDLADYLTKKGLPFREAYKISGKIVAFCMQNGYTLETLPLETYQSFCEIVDPAVYQAIDLHTCVEKRISKGGTGKKSVEEQIEYIKKALAS